MKHSLTTALVLLLLGHPLSASAKITLDVFLDKVRATHPLFERERLSPKIARKEQERPGDDHLSQLCLPGASSNGFRHRL